MRTSRVNLPGKIRTFSGLHFRTSPGHHVGTSLGWLNRIFRGRPGDVGGERPCDALGTIFTGWAKRLASK